ncbi:MAG TPA: phage tail sheath subtilisin-like domain-containing protein [Sphingobium sp.]
MTISFNAIPLSIRVPGAYAEFDSRNATGGLYEVNNRILLVGQKLAAGPIAALTPIRIFDEATAIAAFGRGSMLARMAKFAKAADRYSDIWAIALEDPGAGVQATQTLTFTGPATAAGTIALLIAGQAVETGIASASTATQAAVAAAAAINGMPDLPVTATSAAGVVTVTARHKGTCGNDIDIRHSFRDGETLPAGLTLAIAAATAGTSDPDYATVWTVIGDEDFRTIIVGNATATTLLAVEAELNDRWGPLRMLESTAYAAKRGSVGTATTFGNARNNPLVSTIGTGLSPTAPWEWAASYGAIVGYYSAIDPARPFRTLALPGVIAPVTGARFTRAERELLLRDGISTWNAQPDGTVVIERAITMYQVNGAGVADTAFLDVNTPLTLAYIRQSVRARVLLKYPRHKLADDGTNFSPGQAIVTPIIIRAELIALAREWEEAGLVENIDQFVADIIVERDASDRGRINALLPPDLVNQFHVFAAQIQFRL